MSMMYNSNIKISIFGASHEEIIGISIDGIPSGIEINMEDILFSMKRRQGGDEFSTKRKEEDIPKIISGYFKGKTTGQTLTMIIENKDIRSKDYEKSKNLMRPSHSDYSAYVKYGGYNDYRGGGGFSGRMTALFVCLGAILRKLLEEKGIFVAGRIKTLKDINDRKIEVKEIDKDLLNRFLSSDFPALTPSISKEMKEEIIKAKEKGDSVGGIIECFATGVKAGVGNPYFDSIESNLSKLLFSIPGVKGVEFGEGFDYVKYYGSECRDEFYYNEKGEVLTKTNFNGGINGGISNGMPIQFSVVIKPTPSIGIKQNTINIDTKTNEDLLIVGRHDPAIIKRAVVIIESMMIISLYDFLRGDRVV